MTDIRIIVVSPSAIERSRLDRTLASQPSVKTIGKAAELSEAFTMIESMEPDIVLFADTYTSAPEFDCMRSLVSAIGANCIYLHGPGVCWPRSAGAADTWGRAAPSNSVNCLEDLLDRIHEYGRRQPPLRISLKPVSPVRAAPSDRVVVIGASTGGIDALLTVLAHFPADCPPTAIVQHTGKGFSNSLVRLLDQRCTAKVVVAQDGLILESGMVCVAGGVAGHLELHANAKLRCSLRDGPEISGQIPAVDALFRSAVPFASRTIAVLLTGMGSDGAAGLLELRRAGSFTIGQDEATSVVYGMPRVAFEIGAVRQQLPLNQIGAAIMQLANGPQSADVTGRSARG